MNKTLITSILVLVFIGGFIIFYNPKPISVLTQDNPLILGAEQKWESRTDKQEGVTITVTPIDIFSQAKEWKFNVDMDTHSVELDQDMTKSIVLIDDQDKEYEPINWEGPIGGHHREGMLIFNVIEPMPKSVEIKIKNIGDVVRNFTWQLNNNI